jgi:hypothetical protein
MSPLTAFIVGAFAFPVAGMLADLATSIYRYFRPQRAVCDICHSPEDLDTVLRLKDGQYAIHAACLPEITATLPAPTTGTWRELDQLIDIEVTP